MALLFIRAKRKVDAAPDDNFTDQKNPYRILNQSIESQIFLKDAEEDDDIDYSVPHLVEIFCQIIAMCLWGSLYPLGWVFVYVAAFLRLWIGIFNFLRYYRKPISTGTPSLKTWISMLEITAFLSIFTNSFIISYPYAWFSSEEYSAQTGQFITSIVFSLTLVLIIKFILEGEPDQQKLVRKRQDFVAKKMILAKSSALDEKFTAFITKLNCSTWGDVDVDFIKRKRENKKKSLLEKL